MIETCQAHPNAKIDELVIRFPWQCRLKRSQEWKRRWVADMLRSMIAAGVPLPESTITMLGDEGQAIYEFNEIAYATAPTRIMRTWRDYYRRRVGRTCYSIDGLADTSIAAESMDYGYLPGVSKLLKMAGVDLEMTLDLKAAGKGLVEEITELVGRMERAQPRCGYGAIAEHNVFWNLCSDYIGLQLDLHMREPYCARDQRMADYLAVNYPNVTTISRAATQRYRRKLQTEYEKLIIEGLRLKFASTNGAKKRLGRRIESRV